MNLNKNTYIICILCICALTIYAVILYNQKEAFKIKYKAEIQASEYSKKLHSSLLNNYYELQKASWVHSLYGLNKEITLTSQNNSKMRLSELLQGFTLLFFFNSSMCTPCVNREIENMKELMKTLKSINLIVIAQGYSSNYIFKDSKFKGLESSIFTVSQSPLVAGNLVETPSFVLFKNRVPLFFFHPDKNHNRYFDILMQVLEKI